MVLLRGQQSRSATAWVIWSVRHSAEIQSNRVINAVGPSSPQGCAGPRGWITAVCGQGRGGAPPRGNSGGRMGLRDYLRVLRKRWRWLAMCMVLGAAVAVGLTLATTPKYQATSQLFVASGEINTTGELAQGSTFAQNRVKSYVQLISSDLLLDDVSTQLGIPTAQLAGEIKASAPTDTVLIDITVTDTSPDQAALIANTVADHFPKVARSIEPTRADETPTVTVTVTERATVPSTPVSPRMDLNVGLGLLAGALLGLALMALRQALDTKLKNEDDITG